VVAVAIIAAAIINTKRKPMAVSDGDGDVDDVAKQVTGGPGKEGKASGQREKAIHRVKV
jgi:hypothetical protein